MDFERVRYTVSVAPLLASFDSFGSRILLLHSLERQQKLSEKVRGKCFQKQKISVLDENFWGYPHNRGIKRKTPEADWLGLPPDSTTTE